MGERYETTARQLGPVGIARRAHPFEGEPRRAEDRDAIIAELRAENARLKRELARAAMSGVTAPVTASQQIKRDASQQIVTAQVPVTASPSQRVTAGVTAAERHAGKPTQAERARRYRERQRAKAVPAS